MTRDLPSLDEPAPGATCGRCGEEASALVAFCWRCHEVEMQKLEALVQAAAEMRQRAIRGDHETARKRARTWQLGQGGADVSAKEGA